MLCSFLFSQSVYFAIVPRDISAITLGWIVCLVFIYVAVTTITILLFIPTLVTDPDRIILRPTPCCSTFDKPTRYICKTLNVKRQPVHYVTTWGKCDKSDPNMENATNYYIISSWTPSNDHYVTTKRILFQPESSPGENKQPYYLPEGYSVRAAGPTGEDRQKVAFYSIDGNRNHLLDSGYIDSNLLKKFHTGWYEVSNCRSELSRWWYECSPGYVCSHYVSLPQYRRKLLLEDRDSM